MDREARGVYYTPQFAIELAELRRMLCLEWGELAEKLEVSRGMLGMIRRGERQPGPKLMRRITELRQAAMTGDTQGINPRDADLSHWRVRAIEAENKLRLYRSEFDDLWKELQSIADRVGKMAKNLNRVYADEIEEEGREGRQGELFDGK